MAEPLVQDCRGLILDAEFNWAIVSMSFRKFFNYGENLAAKINWSTATVLEKVDGSLCTLYAYDNSWQVATTGQADAGGRVGKNNHFTFSEYFWDTFRESGMVLPPPDGATCFFFELTGPLNRVVVEHAQPKLTVLGCRHLPSLEESPPSTAAALLQCQSPDAVVRTFPAARSFDALASSFDAISPLLQEGYVVVDGQWNRVKVKHPGYVALHHALSLRGVGRLRAIAHVVRSNEAPEIRASLPALDAAVADAVRRYEALVAAVEADMARLAGCADQRAFALAAAKAPWSGVLFRLRKGTSTTARGALCDIRVEALVGLLGLQDSDDSSGGPVRDLEPAPAKPPAREGPL
jgi:hypothetical protein